MSDNPSPSVDRAVTCALAIGVVSLTLLIIATILISFGGR
jgi:hypothetical protein